ncbi:unnamed protein product [Ranitomeya imitator]|uniref:glutathione transferase n=1 Tax=Ranitomeya imitator TaxID=111125 RepID=A0ABN9M790_9NEOB|nr:unnamed protein product [Ranitomeya imitator]
MDGRRDTSGPHVEVDASEIGAGAVLSQRNSDGSLMKPCAFISRKFSPAERNYDVGNRELLAMKWAFEEWPHWLEGAKNRIVVLTDHKNLIYLESAKRLNPRQARWSLFFSRFDFVVSYIPDLPVSQRMSVIWVVCDRFSKMVHLLPLPKLPSSSDLVPLFFQHVVRLHGIPENIVSDRGSQFVSRSLLRKYVVPVVPSVDPPAPVLIDGELEYVIEKILDSRFSRRKLQYLVKWKGYGQEDNSWVVASDVHADDLVFGQLPQLQHGDFVLYQSNAILRYLGRIYGINGSNSQESALIDMVNDGVEDLRQKYGYLIMFEYETGKEKYIKDLPNHISAFEKILSNNSNGTKFLVGDKISYADYNLLDALHCHLDLDPKCLVSFPLLSEYEERVASRPKLSQYLKSEKRNKRPITPKHK